MRRPLSWFVLFLATLPGMAGAQLRLPPLDIRVPIAPIGVMNGGRTHLVYELRVTNVGRRAIGLMRIEVAAGATTLASFDGDALRQMMVRVADSGDARVIEPGRQSLIYLAVSAATAPETLSHRFLLAAPDSLAGPASDTVAGFPVAVDSRPAPVLEAPLEDGPWLAANGPGNQSGHRRTVIPLEGRARIPQRFATDWVKFGPDGRLWQGDSTRNENWYGYRAPLRAVGAGTVVAIKDGIPENVPLAPNRAVPITLETVGGNHVILDLGGGVFAFYAHLVPGSLRVRVGDRVRPGQIVGLLGNSGNSDAPHLHFHLGDRASPLATEGLPFVFADYQLLGRAPGFSPEPWRPTGTPAARRRELPFEDEVVRFPRRR
ncbi:MAG: M23 family metallopeptidase [Gemmatimonadales bacterium]